MSIDSGRAESVSPQISQVARTISTGFGGLGIGMEPRHVFLQLVPVGEVETTNVASDLPDGGMTEYVALQAPCRIADGRTRVAGQRRVAEMRGPEMTQKIRQIDFGTSGARVVVFGAVKEEHVIEARSTQRRLAESARDPRRQRLEPLLPASQVL